MNQDEAAVVRRAVNGDEAAVEHLFARYNPQLVCTARRILRDASAAEDSAQAAWVQVIRHLPDFRGESQFATWATRIVINEALAIRRKQRMMCVVVEEERHGSVRKRSGETRVADLEALAVRGGQEHRAAARDVSRLLKILPESQRVVVELAKIQGLALTDVAGHLGITLGCVKARLSRGLAMLRDAVEV